MKLKRVWLTCGVPGSGKSTWVQKQISKNGGVWCSRDAVRFSMISDKDEYFACENEVFDQWVSNICSSIEDPLIDDIYIDATHINDNSRKKILNRLPRNKFELTCVVFKVSLDTCLARNQMREGKAFVPEKVIRNMYKSFRFPKNGKIIVINENGEEENNG